MKQVKLKVALEADWYTELCNTIKDRRCLKFVVGLQVTASFQDCLLLISSALESQTGIVLLSEESYPRSYNWIASKSRAPSPPSDSLGPSTLCREWSRGFQLYAYVGEGGGKKAFSALSGKQSVAVYIQ